MENRLEEARAIINRVDGEMAALFEERMRAAEMVYAYKKEMGLPILDEAREAAVIAQNTQRIQDQALKGYYVDYLKQVMAISRAYQYRLQNGLKVAYSDVAVLPIENSCNILVASGILARAAQHLQLQRRVLVVTDSGVPAEYAKTLANQCKAPVIVTLEQGEDSKNLENFGKLMQTMLEQGFSRKDCVVAVGGGVVGDLAGFAASAYMRGIDFYNIPTTLLSQIDSSIGGKTAINFGGVKNIVGAFYQPKAVLIDPQLLATLPRRQLASGLAEAVKMALTSDRELFAILEQQDIWENLETIILRSLRIKKAVVEQDEKEAGLRKILNFGHTVGHGIESCGGLYHGECVALGMIPMCDRAIRPRVVAVLEKCGLLTPVAYDWDAIAAAVFHDKKADGDQVTVTLVREIGSFELKTMSCQAVIDLAKEAL